jgi:hypothetical protein
VQRLNLVEIDNHNVTIYFAILADRFVFSFLSINNMSHKKYEIFQT